jgi:hypothetical protein
MSSVRRAPPVYVPFALLTMFGPLVIMLVQGDPIRPKVAGLAFVVFLLWALARGSVLSWGLLLLWNVFVVFSIAAVSGGELLLPSAPLLLLLALGSAVMLLMPSMRAHVGLRRV